MVHSGTLVSKLGDLGSVPGLAVCYMTPGRSLCFLCFSASFVWYLRSSFTRMLGCRAQRELDLGHYPSTYCKVIEGVGVIRMLLHESWLTFHAFRKSVGYAVLAVW